MQDPFDVDLKLKSGGFDFGNCLRNNALEAMHKGKLPSYRKTGTTIVSSTYKDGVVIGCDSRATEGEIIADKYCMKLHKITDSIYAAGAGTAADLDQVGRMLSAQVTLLELNHNRKARVCAALRIAKQHLFKYQGHVGAYLIIGGVDSRGSHLYNVHASGGTMKLPYFADGSGSLAAISVLEAEYKEGMDESEGVSLVTKALKAGMHGDLASGNTFTYAVIKKDGTTVSQYNKPDFCTYQPRDLEYKFLANKSTKVLKRKEFKFEIVEQMEIA